MACHLQVTKTGAQGNGGSAARWCGSRRTSPMRMRRRRSTPREATAIRCRDRAPPAVGLSGRPPGRRRARGARAARARPARAPRDARREGADHFGRAARAARRAPADRGLYDRRQRRRGQGAGGEEGAGDVPRPRAAEPREAGRAQGLSRDLRGRVRARPGGPAGDVQPDHRAHRRRRFPPADHGADPAQPDPGLLRPAQSRPFRAGARQLRPFHLADPALCRPARPPLAGRRLRGSAPAEATRRTSDEAAGWSGSARRSARPSGARWRPSAKPSTAMSPPISPTMSASRSMRGSPASSRSASSPRSRSWAATGWCRSRRWAPNISATTRPPVAGRDTIGDDYRHRPAAHAAHGRADPVSGALRFELPGGEPYADAALAAGPPADGTARAPGESGAKADWFGVEQAVPRRRPGPQVKEGRGNRAQRLRQFPIA